MFVTTPRASAWLDLTPELHESAEAVRGAGRGAPARTLFAHRSFLTAAGRCIALKRVPARAGRGTAPRLFVLFESRIAARGELRWVAAERVLAEEQPQRRARERFTT